MLADSPVVINLIEVIDEVQDDLSKSGCDQIFLVYIDMFDTFLRNLHSEILGLWTEYVKSLKLMLPYLAASGHRAYTRCMLMFLQEMEDLDEHTVSEFNKGNFVLRRTSQSYAGISPDLAIEQSLMATLKGRSGLTHRRTFNEVNYMTWVLSRPITSRIDIQLREMTKVDYRTSEQSSVKVKQESTARMKEDRKQMSLLEDNFTERCVFSGIEKRDGDKLMNISSGLVAPANVNVDKAFEIGSAIINRMVGEDPMKFTITKASLVVQIPAKEFGPKDSISKTAQIDPQLFFQRALSLVSSGTTDLDLETCLQYELCPIVLSLFDENGFIRSVAKADLAKLLVSEIAHVDKEAATEIIKNNLETVIVLDVGALLYRVACTKNSTFETIIKNYVSHINNMVGKSGRKLVVVDGYITSSTKDHCHLKRAPV